MIRECAVENRKLKYSVFAKGGETPYRTAGTKVSASGFLKQNFLAMEKQINQVKEFHETFKIPVYDKPFMPCWGRASLRYNLLIEEVREFLHSCNEEDIIGASDAIIDILYVAFGTAIEFGIADKLESLFDEVHRSNMSKADENGKPIYNDFGKVMKGPNYSPPNIESILKRK